MARPGVTGAALPPPTAAFGAQVYATVSARIRGADLPGVALPPLEVVA